MILAVGHCQPAIPGKGCPLTSTCRDVHFPTAPKSQACTKSLTEISQDAHKSQGGQDVCCRDSLDMRPPAPCQLISLPPLMRLSSYRSFLILVMNLFLTFPVPPKQQQTGKHEVQTAESQHHCILTAWETRATSIPGNFCTAPASPEGATSTCTDLWD